MNSDRSAPRDGAAQDRAADGWEGAFADRSADSFGSALAEDVVLEASVLTAPLAGRPIVASVMAAASSIYDDLEFTDSATTHHRPLGPALMFSAELGRRLEGTVDSSSFFRGPLP